MGNAHSHRRPARSKDLDVTQTTVRNRLDELRAADRDLASGRYVEALGHAAGWGSPGGDVAEAIRLAAEGLRLEADGRIDDAGVIMEQALAMGVALPGLLTTLHRFFDRTGRDLLAHHAFLMLNLHDPVAMEASMYELPDGQEWRYVPWAVRMSMSALEPDLYGLAELKAALSERHSPEGAAVILASIHAPRQQRQAVAMPLRPLIDFAREHGKAYSEPIPAATVTAHWPHVFGEERRPPYTARSRTLFSAMLEDIVVSGKSNMLLTADVALHDVQADELERIPVDLRVDPLVSARDDDSVIVSAPADRNTLRRIPEAIWLGGVHSSAFGHWIIEFLPKAWALLAGSERIEMPIIIDRQMPRQHMEALRFFAGPVRPLIIEPGEQLRVDRLWVASQLVYMPVGPLAGVIAQPGDAVIDAAGLQRLMQPFQARLEAAEGASQATHLYVPRPPGGRRQLHGGDQVQAMLARHAYRPVHLETLEFSQQIRLIRGAERIIGPDGSALMMALFGRPGIRLGVLSHPYLEEFEWYVQAGEALGHDLTVLVGQITREDPSYRTFSDYRVDLDDVRSFVDALEEPATG